MHQAPLDLACFTRNSRSSEGIQSAGAGVPRDTPPRIIFGRGTGVSPVCRLNESHGSRLDWDATTLWKRRGRHNFVCFGTCRACEWLNTYLAHYQLLKQIEQRHVLRLEFQGGLH